MPKEVALDGAGFTLGATTEPFDDLDPERWTAAGTLDAERGFRKIVGSKRLPALAGALPRTD